MPISIQDKVNLLFIHIPNLEDTGGQQYGVSYVSEQIGCTPGALSSIRHGRTKKPKMETLVGLARFFQVPLKYFQLDSEEECIKMIHDRKKNDEMERQLSSITMKFRSLSDKGREDIVTMLDYILHSEKSDDIEI